MSKGVRWVAVALVIAIAAIAVIILHYAHPATPLPRELSVGGQRVQVEVMDTDATRELGLGGRSGLDLNTGMLFVFPEEGHYAFWMKDMLFAIDIVWIASDGAVVGYFENVAPNTYPQTFSPDGAARYVLELPAGFIKTQKVRVGDVIRI